MQKRRAQIVMEEKMTDLNTAIAKYLGWKCYEQPRSGYRLQYVYAPGKFPWDNYREKKEVKAECVEIDLTQIDPGKFDGQKLPDYEHDARLYMALAVESEFSILYDRYHKKYLAVKLEDEPYIDEHCIDCSFDNCSFGKAGGAVDKSLWQDDLGIAICQAYCKLKGIEVVG
jgi:hypothetical protein